MPQRAPIPTPCTVRASPTPLGAAGFLVCAIAMGSSQQLHMLCSTSAIYYFVFWTIGMDGHGHRAIGQMDRRIRADKKTIHQRYMQPRHDHLHDQKTRGCIFQKNQTKTKMTHDRARCFPSGSSKRACVHSVLITLEKHPQKGSCPVFFNGDARQHVEQIRMYSTASLPLTGDILSAETSKKI